MNGKLAFIVKILVFIVCMAMVIGGQRNIGYLGLCVQMIGLIGLLILLYLYNRQYR